MSETEQISTAAQPTAKKPSLLGKMIGWAIAIGVGLLVANLKGAKKDKWFEEQHQLASRWCEGDAKCLSVVETNWKRCVDDNHESHRRGRYNRDYTLDEAGFRTCLSSSGADHLAQK